MHPPYADIIRYSDDVADLSAIHDIDEFADEMELVAREAYRVLKPGCYCTILIGDTRRHGYFVPISTRVLERFLKVGFVLKEDIIKVQWNCKTTGFWTKRSREGNFLLIMHEHVYVMRKTG